MDTSGYKYIIAYGVMIAILVLVSKTKVGYVAIYYSLILSLFLLLVTHSDFVKNILAPLQTKQPDLIRAKEVV
jgi:hypothetical protein